MAIMKSHLYISKFFKMDQFHLMWNDCEVWRRAGTLGWKLGWNTLVYHEAKAINAQEVKWLIVNHNVVWIISSHSLINTNTESSFQCKKSVNSAEDFLRNDQWTQWTLSRRVLNHHLCEYMLWWAITCLLPLVICSSHLSCGHLLRLKVAANDDGFDFPQASDMGYCWSGWKGGGLEGDQAAVFL